MKLIESAWMVYGKKIMPIEAGPIQIKETRQAFYSGAAVLFSIITSEYLFDGMAEGDIEPTDDDLAKMQMLQDEIDTFGAELDLTVLGIRRH